MEHLIQFRLSMDTLSNTDYETLIKRIDKSVIVEALFHHSNHLQKNNDCSRIQQINNTISEIINEKDSLNTSNNAAVRLPKLDHMPRALINYIASYLNQFSHFHLVNRTTFIASRSPQHLYEIKTTQIQKYVDYCNLSGKNINIKRFDQLQHLKIPVNGIKFLEQNAFTMSHLTTLSVGYRLENAPLDRLISFQNINFKTISRLNLISVQCSISKLLDAVPNLKHLELYEVDKIDEAFSDEGKKVIKQLTSLSLFNCSRLIVLQSSKMTQFLSLCGPKLTALRIHSQLLDLTIIQNYTQLIELCYTLNYDTKFIKNISVIKRFEKLQRVYFDISLYRKSNELQNNVVKFLVCLFALKSLECVSFSIFVQDNPNAIDAVLLMKLMEKTFLLMKTKKTLKVLLNICWNTHSIALNIHERFISIVNLLNNTVSDDFMFVVKLNFPGKCEPIKKIKSNIEDWLNHAKHNLSVRYDMDNIYGLLSGSLWFDVCNNKCKINKEDWIIQRKYPWTVFH